MIGPFGGNGPFESSVFCEQLLTHASRVVQQRGIVIPRPPTRGVRHRLNYPAKNKDGERLRPLVILMIRIFLMNPNNEARSKDSLVKESL